MGDVIYTETEEQKLVAKEELIVLPQSDYGENWVMKDIDGYREGAWFVTLSKLVSGGSIVEGSINNQEKIGVKGVMPHGDVDIIFNYVFGNQYIEYRANAEGATGTNVC